MEFNDLHVDDTLHLWEINEDGLPGTGEISPDEITNLLNLGEFCIGAFEENKLVGFVICLLPNTKYGSENYAWFNNNYDDFLYVDRIAVSKKYRNCKIGSKLYQKVIDYAQELNLPIAAEVSINPPNPGSIRFHLRHDFIEVGVLHHEKKSVTMMLRNP
ncbi:MAG TPA: GNAT family N-acetyltransferase [Candidatus Poseidoniaceae archaeon]|nr:GNAT family N-acetyltransferase [Candidatus Poseidoniaceae archaeon]